MLRYGHIIIFTALLVLVVASGGCQRRPTWSLAPVEGTVTKNGRPLPAVEVIFLADPDAGTEGPRTAGKTDQAGHYRLTTDVGDDGVVVGKHRVLIRDLDTKQLHRVPDGRQRKATTKHPTPEAAKRFEEQLKASEDALRVPLRYGRFQDTPLRVEVQSGPQVIDFDVK